MKHKVFLSGRITGDRDYKAKFDRIAAELKGEGYIVLNPATLPMGLSYADYARICHAMIEAAETVLLLPGYTRSPGAMLEMKYALYIGKEVEVYGQTDKQYFCKRSVWDDEDCNW